MPTGSICKPFSIFNDVSMANIFKNLSCIKTSNKLDSSQTIQRAPAHFFSPTLSKRRQPIFLN